MIDEYANKLSSVDLVFEEDDEIRYEKIVEHKWFNNLPVACGKWWHVIPNPRKSESTDVFIVRNDHAVLLVSMKAASVSNDAEHDRFFRHHARSNGKHIDALLAFNDEMMYTIEPTIDHQRTFPCRSPLHIQKWHPLCN